MNVLIACEESQRVCIAFRERGHNAFSCEQRKGMFTTNRARNRSKTFEGIARAMAEQWGVII